MERVSRLLTGSFLFLSLSCLLACGYSSSSSSSNNTITSTTISTVTVSPGTVNGGKLVTATVTLTGPAPQGGLIFTVSSTNFSIVFNNTINYMVPAGQASFSFGFQTLPVGSPQSALIIVTSSFGQTESASLTINSTTPLQLTGFALTSITKNSAGQTCVAPLTTVTSGATVCGTISLNAAAFSPGQQVVVVSSDSAVSPVNPVTVPTGQSSTTFSIFTQPINGTRTVTITASLNGVSMSRQLTLMPAGTAITSLNFVPASVAGGQSTTGIATVTPPAPAGGETITLMVAFANPATPQGTPLPFTVPATVMVPAGATQVQFTATTTTVTTTTDLTVTATLGTTGVGFNVEVVPSISLTAVSCNPGVLTGGNMGMPGNSATCTLSLSLPAAAQGQPVMLTTSDSNSLPLTSATVTIPPGQASTTFTVTAGAPTAITTVTLSASISGSKVAPVTTTVMVVPAGSLTVIGMSLNPLSVLGGAGAAGNSTGSLTISGPAPPGGTALSLTSSNTGAAQVPMTVTVPPNSTTTTFNITTAAVAAQVNVTITATVNNSTQTATLAVVPVPVLVGVSLSAVTVGGGSTVSATIILASAAPAGPGCAPPSSGVCVTLASSSNLVQIVPNVTVPAGRATVNFLVTTLPVTSQQTVNITATLGAVSQQVTLTLTLPPPDTRLVVFNPPTVIGGNPSTGIVALTAPALSGGTTVTLSSGSTSVTVPASVVVMPGQTTASFSATTTSVTGSTTAVITATVTASVTTTLILLPAPSGTTSEQIIAAGETNSTDFPTHACPTSAGTPPTSTSEFCGPLTSGQDSGFLTSINQSTPAGGATTSSLSFSTLVGLSSFGQARDVTVDSSGNVFACGVTSDQHLPTTSTAAQAAYGGGNTDAFIVEFNSSGALQYLSYLGGSGDEACYGITVDSLGAIYVSGRTTNSTAMNATNLMGTTGALQTTNAGGNDFFMAKLNPTTTNAAGRIVWLTLLGGSADDFADGRIAVGSTGSVFVTGTSMSVSNTPPAIGFPTPSRPPLNGVGTFGVVVQIAADGTSLLSSTLLFGRTNGANPGVLTTTTASGGLAFDVLGNAYVCGQTNASDLPVSSGAFQPALKGQQDAYVARLTAATGVISALTYLGGTGSAQRCTGLSVDSEHNPVVVVPTDAQDFPATGRATTTGLTPVMGPMELNGPSDVSISKLSSDLSTLIFSSLVGGTGSETGAAWAPGMPGDTTRIPLDLEENFYFSVPTTSTDFPITGNAVFNTPPGAGGQKIAIVKLSSDGGTILYGTYLGGSASNSAGSLAYRKN